MSIEPIVGKISCEPLLVEDGENILDALRRIISKACGDENYISSVRERTPEVSNSCHNIYLKSKKMECHSGLIDSASECSSWRDFGADSGADDLPEDQITSKDCIEKQLTDINKRPSEKETREQKYKDPFEDFYTEDEDMSLVYPESSHTADNDSFGEYYPDDDPFDEYYPDDDPVFAESGETIKDEEAMVANKAKTLTEKQSEIEKRRQLDLVLKKVKRKPSLLGKVENQTEEMGLATVESDGRALMYVHEGKKTYKVCLAAVKKFGGALAFVPMKKRTDEMCMTAVKNYGRALAFVPEEKRTEEICANAIKNDSLALQYVPESKQTNQMLLDAVTNKGITLRFIPIPKRSIEICTVAVRNYGMGLKFVPKILRSTRICMDAIKNNGKAFQYVPKDKRTPEICQAAVEKVGCMLQFVPEDKRNSEICAAAVRQDVNALEYVPLAMRTPEIWAIAANLPEKILSKKTKRILKIHKKLHDQQKKR